MLDFRADLKTGMNEPLDDDTVLRDKNWIVVGSPLVVAAATPVLSTALNK